MDPRPRPTPRVLFPGESGDEFCPRQLRQFDEPATDEEIADQNEEEPVAGKELAYQDEEPAAEEEDDDPVAETVEERWVSAAVSESDNDSSKTIPFQFPKY